MSHGELPDSLDHDDSNPPTNDEGEFVCGRECVDGTRCLTPVWLPYIACWNHNRDDPIV